MKVLILAAISIMCFDARAELVNQPYHITYFSYADNNEQHSREMEEVTEFMKSASNKGWKVSASFEVSHSWKSVKKQSGESIESILEKTKGCESLKENCLKIVQGVNRNPEATELNHKGSVTVPVKKVILKITIEAGDNYRVETIGNKTNAYISRELFDLKQKIIKNTYASDLSSFCRNVDDPNTCSFFKLNIVEVNQ